MSRKIKYWVDFWVDRLEVERLMVEVLGKEDIK